MQSLQTLIDMLTKGRRTHISILDLNGVLDLPRTQIDFCNVIHSKKFCNMAKSSERGYRLCLHCKSLANMKGHSSAQPFCGYCFFGLYEAAYPVVINGGVCAIVYVGNAVIDPSESEKRLRSTCRYLGTDPEPFCEELSECERLQNGEELLQIAEIVADYLRLLFQKTPKTAPAPQLHWLVVTLKRHAEEELGSDLSLKKLSLIYHKNEKYMGRLFRREMGVSFSEYCMSLRLRKAAGLLLDTRERVVDIALECGFNTVTYFNRVFTAEYGTSPTEYRRQNT